MVWLKELAPDDGRKNFRLPADYRNLNADREKTLLSAEFFVTVSANGGDREEQGLTTLRFGRLTDAPGSRTARHTLCRILSFACLNVTVREDGWDERIGDLFKSLKKVEVYIAEFHKSSVVHETREGLDEPLTPPRSAS